MAVPKRRKQMTETQVGENSRAALRSEFIQNSVWVKDIKASGNAGGSFAPGAWRTRVLNTLENPSGVSWISLNSNQFTLQPGTYEIIAKAPAYRVAYHIARLRNITDEATVMFGTGGYAVETLNVQTDSVIMGSFTITAQKTFEIQHSTATAEGQAGAGFGVDSAAYAGDPSNTVNIFTSIMLRKVA